MGFAALYPSYARSTHPTARSRYFRVSSNSSKIRRYSSYHASGWTKPWRRSEEHTSELQSLMRISYAVFCLKKKKNDKIHSEQQTLHKLQTNNHIITTNKK